MKQFKLTVILFFFGFILINAQTEVTKEKLNNLKGNVVKITIETDDDEVEITGEDANKLLDKMKSENHFIIKKMHHGNMGKNMVFIKKGDDEDGKEIKIDVEVEDTDGDKIVVIKKTVDGKETVEKFIGEEAEKFIEEHEAGEHGLKFISEDGEQHIVVNIDSDDINWVSKGDKLDTEKKIKVEIKDGVKKVTVTTKSDDGEEEVKVYEGEEAEEFLEKMEQKREIEFNSSIDGKKKIKKIIVIEKEEEE